MNIGVDVREIQDGVITGIGRSLSNFIQYFGDNELKHKLFLFSEKELKIDRNTNIENIALKENSTFIWDQWKLPKSMKNCNIDLFYSPYYKIPLLSDIPTVGQILDLMFLIHPDYKNNLPISHKLYYAIFGRAFAKKSLSIITDSEHAKNDIIKLWNVNPQKIVVIPLGLAYRYRPVKDKQLLNQVRKKMIGFGIDVMNHEVELILSRWSDLKQLTRIASKNHTGFTESEVVYYNNEKLKETFKIYILHNMPTYHFIATAAHELMHVWQRMNGSSRNHLITIEGSCNYASYLVLSTYEDKRAKYILESLKQDDNPIYGDGFRLIKEYVEKNDLDSWLKALHRGEFN